MLTLLYSGENHVLKLQKAIQNLKNRDPTWASVINYVEQSNIPDKKEQICAINDMYNGKISYAEMRMLAG